MRAVARSLLAAAATFAVAIGTAGTAGTARADITVGSILSLTGPAASLGIPERDTIALWPKTIGNQKINVIVLDDASDPTQAVLAARKLVNEHKIDVLVGPSITPATLAVLDVMAEARTPIVALAGGGAIVNPLEGSRRWAFKMVPDESLPMRMILDHMRSRGGKTLGIVAAADAYGETFLKVAQAVAPTKGVEIVGVERFNRTDQTFAAQGLKLISAKPDAIFIIAAGTPAAMPQIELVRRGYRGQIYQTQAVANNDFLRVGGKDVDGAILPVAPVLVAEQLPDSNPIKKVAVDYVTMFEAKHGPGSRSLFGGTAWDAFLFVQRAVPTALRRGQPGTPEFRTALRDAIEQTRELVGVQGVFNMSEKDHIGTDERSQVLVRIENGRWRLVQ